mmetsp:Transcript_12460/g.43084  ORF Transcript_12460/g.43084 Transcript_12460/m.43084 type:complete len:245 (+) Transcript_12460:520-1254(+)
MSCKFQPANTTPSPYRETPAAHRGSSPLATTATASSASATSRTVSCRRPCTALSKAARRRAPWPPARRTRSFSSTTDPSMASATTQTGSSATEESRKTAFSSKNAKRRPTRSPAALMHLPTTPRPARLRPAPRPTMRRTTTRTTKRLFRRRLAVRGSAGPCAWWSCQTWPLLQSPADPTPYKTEATRSPSCATRFASFRSAATRTASSDDQPGRARGRRRAARATRPSIIFGAWRLRNMNSRTH